MSTKTLYQKKVGGGRIGLWAREAQSLHVGLRAIGSRRCGRRFEIVPVLSSIYHFGKSAVCFRVHVLELRREIDLKARTLLYGTSVIQSHRSHTVALLLF